MEAKTYFVAGLPTEAARKLADSGLLASDGFAIDGDMGVLFNNDVLEKVLTLINAKKVSEAPSDYEGIYFLLLLLNDRPVESLPVVESAKSVLPKPVEPAGPELVNPAVPEPVKPVVPEPAKPAVPESVKPIEDSTVEFSLNDWMGAKDERFIAAAKKILAPILRDTKVRKIKICSPKNNKIALANYREQETIFRIFLGCHLAEYEEAIKTPAKLWGIGVTDASVTACLTYRGAAVCDPSGHVAAELHGHNLIIFHYINHLGETSEAEIFTRILQETAAILTAPIKPGVKTFYQLMNAVQTDDESGVKSFRKSTALALVQKFDKVKTVTLHGHGGLVEPTSYPSKDGEYHVFFHAGCCPGDKRISPKKIFGIDVECRGSAPTAPSEGVHIVDSESDYIAAEVVDNNLFIFHFLNYSSSPAAIQLYERILAEALSVWQKPAEQLAAKKVERERRRREKDAEAYVAHCEALAKEKAAAAEKQAEEQRQLTQACYQQCVERTRQASENEDKARALETQAHVLAEKLRAEYDRLRAVPRVLKVAVNKNGDVTIWTDTLCCANSRKRKTHQIGRFEITVNVNTGYVGWENQDGTMEIAGQRFNAPQVDAAGRAMNGDVNAAMVELVGQYEFAALAGLAIQYIETSGEGEESWRRLEKWPVYKPAPSNVKKQTKTKKKMNKRKQEKKQRKISRKKK